MTLVHALPNGRVCSLNSAAEVRNAHGLCTHSRPRAGVRYPSAGPYFSCAHPCVCVRLVPLLLARSRPCTRPGYLRWYISPDDLLPSHPNHHLHPANYSNDSYTYKAMYGMHHHCYRRGGSRLVWFIIGGVSTAWWMRAREHHAAYHQHQQIGCTWKHRRELEAPHPGVEPADAQRPFFESWGFHAPRPGPAAVSPQGAAPASAQVPMSAPVPTPGQQPAHGMSWEEVQKERWADEQRARVAAAQQWEDEKEQLRSFAKQAETKVRSLHTFACWLANEARVLGDRLFRVNSRPHYVYRTSSQGCQYQS